MKGNKMIREWMSRMSLILLTIIVITGCSESNSDFSTGIDPDPMTVAASETADAGIYGNKDEYVKSTEPLEDVHPNTGDLSESELEEFSVLFNTPEYSGFLIESFDDISEINWETILGSGAGINAAEVSVDEVDDYLQTVKRNELYTDLIVLRKTDILQYIRNHSGKDIDPDSLSLPWLYIEDRNSYYFEQWSSDEKHYTCISGERSGDEFTLRFQLDGDVHFGKNADRVVKCTKSGDDLIMESNAVQWEDLCDASQTFDIDLSGNGDPVRFITYPADGDKGVSIVMLKNGKHLQDINTSVYRGNENGYLSEITAVGFFNFNADDVKDIVITGRSDLGENILLYESVNTDEYYIQCYGIDEKLEKELGSGFTISRVKEALLGDNRESRFDSYQKAYAQIAKIYNMSSDELLYGLIDTDGDDIPELVIDKPGYHTSLYSYNNGHAECLMYQWAYGAMGNSGYSYAPGKGVFYNMNSDYAGAVYHESYMSKREGAEIDVDYAVTNYCFKDIDGDGQPSEEELEATGDYAVYSKKYYNETDEEMPEEEVKKKIEQLEGLQYEFLGGDKDYEDLIGQMCYNAVGYRSGEEQSG